MNRGVSWLDIGIATIIAALIVNLINDFWGWRKVGIKLGKKKSSSLEEQHEDIQSKVLLVGGNIERIVVDKTSSIYAKVEKTGDIIIKNENLYQSLDLEQKEISNNVNRLLYEWQDLNIENKELKKQMIAIKEQNNILIKQSDGIKEEMTKIKEQNNNLTWQNNEIRAENNELQKEVAIVREQNNTLIKQSDEIRTENKELSKQLETAKRPTINRNKTEEYNNILENEDEDDWDLEL